MAVPTTHTSTWNQQPQSITMQNSRGSARANWRIKEPDSSASRCTVPIMEYASHKRQMQRRRTKVERYTGDGPRIYVGNLLYTVQISDIQKLFKVHGFDVANIDMSIEPYTFKNTSFCFVDLVSVSAATSAMEKLNGITFFGRPLSVKPCTQKRDPQLAYLPDGVISNHWQSIARMDEIQESLKVDMTMVDDCRVYVKGLPRRKSQYIHAEIWDLFRGFDVKDVSAIKSPRETFNPKTMNLHYAFVNFFSPEDAKAAVRSLNGREAFGGVLTVRMAKPLSGAREEDPEGAREDCSEAASGEHTEEEEEDEGPDGAIGIDE